MEGESTSLLRATAEWVGRADVRIYESIAGAPTPRLDRALRGLSRAADFSRLSLAAAAGLALFGGPQGRRAAARGLACVAVTSGVVNLALKPLARRRRPHLHAEAVAPGARVPMPDSHSFPSGHSAAAFAFATGAGRAMPQTALPLGALATAVAYSRVHTGVHYPSDVLVGALCGILLARFTERVLDRA